MVLEVLEVLEVLKFLVVWAIYRLLTGSWQEAKCECLLELLTALTGAVRNLPVLSGGMNNLLMLYFFNYIIFKTTLSYSNSRMLKFTITLYPLILTCTGPVFKLIILSLYSTNSFKIITNAYSFFFFNKVFLTF